MPQSLANILVHLVFSTQHRQPVLTVAVQDALGAFVGGILANHDCRPLSIGIQPDHAHLLFALSRTLALADAVKAIKTQSSEWLRAQHGLTDFHWQHGYGAFSVSVSSISSVHSYIEKQSEHHRKLTFQDELRRFLSKHQVTYDERYLWD